MSQPLVSYLRREHQRLEQELRYLEQQRFPDPAQVARIKKLKLLIKDRMAQAALRSSPAITA